MKTPRRPRRRLLRVLVPVAAVLAVTLACVGSLVYVAFLRGPEHSPEDFLHRGRAAGTQRVVVAAGASLTQGSLGADWVGALRTRRAPDGYEFVNAGRNGDTSAGLLGRLDTEVIACQPDAVTLLIGTNDVRDGVPVDQYRASMDAILTRLGSADIRVAVLSLPPVGEDLGSERNQRAEAFNHALHEVAASHGAAYLPLHEQLVALVSEDRPVGGEPYNFGFGLALRTAWDHYVLGHSWDEIATGNKLTVLTDHIHLSDRAGDVVADLVDTWLSSELG